MRRDPLRDRVVSVAAVHLQLHRLSAPERQCVCAEHAGEVQGSSNSAGRAECLASHLAGWDAGYLAVLWKLRYAPLWRTRRTAGNRQPACRDARRHIMAGAGGAFLHAQRAVMVAAGARGGVFRDPAGRLGKPADGMACPLERLNRMNGRIILHRRMSALGDSAVLPGSNCEFTGTS